MSELSELIKINKNIERQNEEIIRLLSQIAGEKPEVEETAIEKIGIDASLEVGEVLFVEGSNIFRLSIKNNEISIDNLTGDGKARDFKIHKIIADESIKNNKPIEANTVILGNAVRGNLPEALEVCVENKIAKVMVPWNLMKELVNAPYELQTHIKLDFYKNMDDLINKMFYT